MLPAKSFQSANASIVSNGLLTINRLSTWKRNTFLLQQLFSAAEWQRITNAQKSIDRSKLVIVSVAWECPWAKSGGVASIAKLLPGSVADHLPPNWQFDADFPKVIRIAPFHSKVFKFQVAVKKDGVNSNALKKPIKTSTIQFNSQPVTIEIFEVATKKGETWYLFKDKDNQFFQADGGSPRGALPNGSQRKGTDPYFYSAETTAAQRDSLNSLLLRDVLFAAKAVPVVLAELGFTENLVIHAHDWTFSALALTVKEELARNKGLLKSAVVILTFHNPFDHLVRDSNVDMLSLITNRTNPAQWPFPFNVASNNPSKPMPDTLFECMLGLFDSPIAIVSPGFADEVCGSSPSPLQSFHFAPHLQGPLAYQGAVGIQNASFLPKIKWQSYTKKQINTALNGDPNPILKEKILRQQKMADMLAELKNDENIRITGSLVKGDAETVYLHMLGRFDPSQKGFDVFAHAIERYLQKNEDANVRFIITPLINGLEPIAFYQQITSLASKHTGKVILSEGFFENTPLSACGCNLERVAITLRAVRGSNRAAFYGNTPHRARDKRTTTPGPTHSIGSTMRLTLP